jgi:hypothetical protein
MTRNIQLQAPKSENPSANARVSKVSVVARGGIDRGLRMSILIETFGGIGLPEGEYVLDVGFVRVPHDHFRSHRRSDVENVSTPNAANNSLQVCCDATTDRSVSQAPAVSQSMQSQNSVFWPWANLIQPPAKTVPDLACYRSD